MTKTERNNAAIEAAHEFVDGQAYSWEACGVCGTDTCSNCGLQRHWHRGGQNSGSLPDTYTDAAGNELTPMQARNHPCE